MGEPVERIPTPRRLRDWLDENGLAVPECSEEELAAAARLLPPDAVRVINPGSSTGRAAPALTDTGGLRWRLDADRVQDALSVVITADAVRIIARAREGRLALCASPTCRAVFLDASRSRTRRWCDMNSCGNREKLARMLSRARERS